MVGFRGILRSSVLGLLVAASAAHAGDISFVDIFKNLGYEQTGNGNSLIVSGDFFSADLNSLTAGFYGSATLNYPGPGTTQTLTEASPAPNTDYHYQSASYASQLAMDTDFPIGTYSFQGDNGDTASLDYTEDDYSSSLPYLTGGDYLSLQNVDPSAPISLHFSNFNVGAAASSAFIFFTIYDYTLGKTVYAAGFLAPGTTSVTIPSGTLAVGDSFDYEIDFSDRDTGVGNGGTFSPEPAFDVRTDGTFSTELAPASTPEPSTLLLAGIGLVALGMFRRRK